MTTMRSDQRTKPEILLLTSNGNPDDERIAQRIEQIKKVMPDAVVTVHCVQGTEESIINASIEKINSASYSSVILDSELAAHPWFIINDYRGQRPENGQLKFIVEGEVSALTQAYLASQDMMGSVLVVKEDKNFIEIYRGNLTGTQVKASGKVESKSLGVEEKIGADTQHNICSIFKMLTGITVLKLAEKTPELLTAPVYQYLPDNFPQKNEYKSVTVGNLLTHTSGMGDYTRKYNEALDDASQPHPVFRTLSDIAGFADPVKGLEGMNETQRPFYYSNLGFAVLGEVIERVINADRSEHAAPKSYWDAVEECVLKPAEAKILRDNPSLDKPFATNGAFPTTRHIASCPAGGNIWATPEHLAKFAKWVIDQHKHDPKFQPLLQSIKLKDHYQPDGAGYAFGIIQRRVDGQAVYCHGGGAPGVSSDLRIYPEDNAAIIVFNNNGSKAADLGQRLESNVLKAHNIRYLDTRAVIGREMRDYVLPQKGEEFKTDLQLPRPCDVSSRSSTAFMSRSGIEISSSNSSQPELVQSYPRAVQNNNRDPKPGNRDDEDKAKESPPFRPS